MVMRTYSEYSNTSGSQRIRIEVTLSHSILEAALVLLADLSERISAITTAAACIPGRISRMTLHHPPSISNGSHECMGDGGLVI